MSVIAKQDITLFFIKDISSVTRYYTLQSSEPSVPTTNPPSGEWSDSEPSYTSGSDNTLYFVDLTVFTDESWAYSNVSKSSSYEAAKEAYNKANTASDAVDNLQIGGRNLLTNTNTDKLYWYIASNDGTIEQSSGISTSLGTRYDKFTITKKSTTWSFIGIIDQYAVKKVICDGGVFTISFDVYCDVSKDIILKISKNNGTKSVIYFGHFKSAAAKWTKITMTGNVESGVDYDGQFIYMYVQELDEGSFIEFTNFKLEKGNKATDWTPAPEDIATKNDLENATSALDQTIIDHVSALQQNEDSIVASVSKLETTIIENADYANAQLRTLEQKVSACVTEEAVDIRIDTKLQNGVNKVETATGFRFDEKGLNISKSSSPTNTQITENGMTVNNTETSDTMLTADKDGVAARNLSAETYLIVGGYSRFENYKPDGAKRTGCFWIGE